GAAPTRPSSRRRPRRQTADGGTNTPLTSTLTVLPVSGSVPLAVQWTVEPDSPVFVPNVFVNDPNGSSVNVIDVRTTWEPSESQSESLSPLVRVTSVAPLSQLTVKPSADAVLSPCPLGVLACAMPASGPATGSPTATASAATRVLASRGP